MHEDTPEHHRYEGVAAVASVAEVHPVGAKGREGSPRDPAAKEISRRGNCCAANKRKKIAANTFPTIANFLKGVFKSDYDRRKAVQER